MLGLVLTAAMALVAFAGVGSASATSLCTSFGFESELCEGEVLPANTPLELGAEAGTYVKFEGGLSRSCSKAVLKGSNYEESGEPLVGGFGTVQFSGCMGAYPIVGTPEPWIAEFTRTTGGDGTVKITGGGGAEVGYRELGGGYPFNCWYKAKSMELDFVGGSPAKLIASKEPFKGSCGEQKVSGTFVFSQPNPLFLGDL
jgi:hypothetical protein